MTCTKTILVLFGLLFLTACATASDTFTKVVEGMVENGSITPDQGVAMVQAWEAQVSAGSDWWVPIVNILGGALLAWIGVRSNVPLIGRGRPTQVVGLPSSKIKDAT